MGSEWLFRGSEPCGRGRFWGLFDCFWLFLPFLAISGSWGEVLGSRMSSGWPPSRVLDLGPGALAVLAVFGRFWLFWGLFRIFCFGGDFEWGPGLIFLWLLDSRHGLCPNSPL